MKLQLCVDSKDIFTSLSSKLNSIDRSIQSDVAFIWFEIHVGPVDKIKWIPGRLNLADVLTKPDIPLTGLLRLALYTSKL